MIQCVRVAMVASQASVRPALVKAGISWLIPGFNLDPEGCGFESRRALFFGFLTAFGCSFLFF
jgi:hypothetical protein